MTEDFGVTTVTAHMTCDNRVFRNRNDALQHELFIKCRGIVSSFVDEHDADLDELAKCLVHNMDYLSRLHGAIEKKGE